MTFPDYRFRIAAVRRSRTATLNLYQNVGNNPATFTDPFGLCPGCLVAALATPEGLALLGATTALLATQADNLADAGTAVLEGTRNLVSGAVAAVSQKTHNRHLEGQQDNILTHFGKISGGGPGDPEKWKRDIQKGLREMRKRFDRLKDGKFKDQWRERIEQLQQRLDQLD